MPRKLPEGVKRLGCRREFPERGYERCGKPAGYIVWGKLFPPEALGPRCRDCVEDQVGHRATVDPVYAIYKLPDLPKIEAAVEARVGERIREALKKNLDEQPCFCNKCGYFGPDEIHAGCDYLAGRDYSLLASLDQEGGGA